jgi:hypothetical protein
MDTEPGQLDNDRGLTMRPTAMVEVRAWIAFGMVTLVHIATGVWWASAISVKLDHHSEQLVEVKQTLTVVKANAQSAAQASEDKRMLLQLVADHEARLRQLERMR